MTELEGIINHWQSTLDHQQYLLEPATKAIIFLTIKYLKNLQQIKGGTK